MTQSSCYQFIKQDIFPFPDWMSPKLSSSCTPLGRAGVRSKFFFVSRLLAAAVVIVPRHHGYGYYGFSVIGHCVRFYLAPGH